MQSGPNESTRARLEAFQGERLSEAPLAREGSKGRLDCALKDRWSQTNRNRVFQMGTEWGHFVEKAGAEAETVKECPVVNATEEWVWRSEKEREC